MRSARALTGVLAAALLGVPLLTGTAAASEFLCRDFATQAAAQRFHDSAGAGQRALLDADGDRIACEELLVPPTTSSTPPTSTTPSSTSPSSTAATATSGATATSAPTGTGTTTTTTPPTTTTTSPVDDRDCTDFATQAEAQAALAADSTDPDDLDADGDGTACEDRFRTFGQQVSVVPNGGVATGGLSGP